MKHKVCVTTFQEYIRSSIGAVLLETMYPHAPLKMLVFFLHDFLPQRRKQEYFDDLPDCLALGDFGMFQKYHVEGYEAAIPHFSDMELYGESREMFFDAMKEMLETIPDLDLLQEKLDVIVKKVEMEAVA